LKYFLNFLGFLLLLWGCGDEESLSGHIEANYFPLEVGWYQVYDVQETRYQITASPEAMRYELMMQVVDSFPSGNDYTYVIHRSIRPDASVAWELLDTWSARMEGNALVVSEGNTAYVKLTLPVADGVRWDGNAYNALGKDEYEIRDAGRSYVLDGTEFENTVTVDQEHNDDRIVFRDERKEVYANDIGLIYKEFIQLDYCTADPCLGLQQVDEGVEVIMTIIGYGKE